MRISQQLLAYRNDPARRRLAANAGKAAQDDWQRHTIWQPYQERFAKAADLPPLEAVALLSPILADRRISAAFTQHFAAMMRGDWLANIQYPATLSPYSTSIIIYGKGHINISLALVRPMPISGAERISLSSGATALRLINQAQAAYQIFDDVDCDDAHACVRAGKKADFACSETVTIDNGRQGMSLTVRGAPALFLRITADDPQSILCQRHYDSKSGQLLGQAAGDKRATQRLMLLSALRAMDAGQHIKAMLMATEEPVAALRWQAMRECLATDIAASLPRLTQMAECDKDAEIRALARQVLTICAAKAA